jgi:hypothetical protein
MVSFICSVVNLAIEKYRGKKDILNMVTAGGQSFLICFGWTVVAEERGEPSINAKSRDTLLAMFV